MLVFYFSDTIHTERFMRTPDENKEGYEKCSILNSDMQNFKKVVELYIRSI